MKSLFLLLFVALISIGLSSCNSTGKGEPSGQILESNVVVPALESNEPESKVESQREVNSINIAEYKELARILNEDIMSDSILLSNMGQHEHSFWEALESVGGTIDYEYMVSSASDWLSRKAGADLKTLSESYENIGDQYKNFVELSVTDPSADEISNNVNNLFSAYNSLYLLVTDPSGSRSSFSDKFNEHSNTITTCNSILSVLVSD